MNHATQTTLSDYSVSGIDLFLAVLGIVGAVLFGLFLPAEHSDSTAAFEISEEEAIAIASDFLVSQGLNPNGLESEASLRRDKELLLDLQSTLDRPTTVEFLESENRNQLAAYFWRVAFVIPRDPEKAGFTEEPKLIYQLSLAQNGKIIGFNDLSISHGSAALSFGISLEKVQREALSHLLSPDSLANTDGRRIFGTLPDSVFVNSFRFDLQLSRSIPNDSLLASLEAMLPAILDSTRVRGLVDYHLDQSAFSGLDWDEVSMQILNNSGRPYAQVELKSSQPVAGLNIKLVTKIGPFGAFSGLNASYSKEAVARSSASQILEVLGVGLIILLSFIFVVVFFRRMMARLLDMKSAMIDAMLLGLAVGAVAILTVWDVTETVKTAPLWGEIGLNILVFSFAAGGVAVFAFMIAGVTDSVVREYDGGKLKTLILLRHGDIVNRPLGASFLRGSSVAGILLGLSVLILSLFPQVHLELDPLLLADSSSRPFATVLFGTLSSSYFLVLIWMVGVSAVAFKWSKQPWLAMFFVAVSGSILSISPFSMMEGGWSLIVGACFSILLAWAYIRFDILTVLVGLFLSKLIWQLSEGMLISGSTSWIDLMLGVLFVLSILVLGVLGVISRHLGQEADTYVPGYVAEMAGQVRVKRELEIAQQVQTFFLPRKMPTVAGLEIAGMCLPATEVGGDYYDFVELEDGKMAFILGDVSGKGIEAAFFMTLVKGIIQTLSRQNLSAVEVMQNLNHLFCANAPKGTFISVIYGQFDPKDSSFTFSRAGHNPAILFEAESSSAKALQPKGMAIGFTDGVRFNSTIEQVKVLLKPGDSMVFYTDGFSEAMNRKRDLYGDDRLLAKVSQYGNRSASALLRLLTEDVHHFIEGMGRADDMTMVVLKLKAPEESHA
ncbi:MAG: PP2C family protein-serine/threonine phosphatase [Bacteroidetes bacterium]|nr:PP2C family protein-serine/threonine phosphatase [Bacteroidota bacterium]